MEMTLGEFLNTDNPVTNYYKSKFKDVLLSAFREIDENFPDEYLEENWQNPTFENIEIFVPDKYVNEKGYIDRIPDQTLFDEGNFIIDIGYKDKTIRFAGILEDKTEKGFTVNFYYHIVEDNISSWEVE